MATFSVNQVRQLYVAKELKSSVASTDNAGSIAPKSDTAKTSLRFDYIGAGGQTRSDLIKISNITSAKATDADSLKLGLKKYKVTLDTEVNSGAPVIGLDYIMRIAFRNYIGLSEEDQYFKYGMVHVVSGMNASAFYKTLILSLVKNFSRETSTLFKFYLTTSSTTVEVTNATNPNSLTGTYTGIILEEVAQEWILGTFEQLPLNFTIQFVPVTYSGDERIWGVVEKLTSTSFIENGKKTADLEYFLMGERGDQYRMINFPNVIRTTYLVDPTIKYNYIDITYNHSDGGVNVQNSEKAITLVVPKVGATNSVSNVLTNDIIGAINTASGLSIATLDVSA